MTNFRWIFVGFMVLGSFSVWAAKPCEGRLTPSDQAAIDAHVLGALLPMGEMRDHLERLTGVKPLPSGYLLKDRRSDENRAIARMVIAQMARNMGYSNIEVENFNGGANVIVELPGTSLDHEVIEVTAHYDSVVTGGDDNGSGVAFLLGLLSLARHCEHERRIRVVFMDLEEQGMHGSRYHTQQVRKARRAGNGPEFVGAIVVDTIGWAHPESQNFLAVLEVGHPSHHNRGYEAQMWLAREVNYVFRRIGLRDGLLLSPEIEGAMPSTTDLGSYWREGLPAVLFAAAYEPGFVNPNYHEPGDTIANMNWDYYQRMGRALMEMTAYVSGMRLKNSNLVSDTTWTLARQLENRGMKKEKFKLDPSADRDLSLSRSLQRRAPHIEDFEPEEKAVKTLKSKKKKPRKIKAVSAVSAEENLADMARYEKLVRIAMDAEGSDLNLILFGPDQGVLVTGEDPTRFLNLSATSVQKLSQVVKQRDGAVFEAKRTEGQFGEYQPSDARGFVKAMQISLRLRYAKSTRVVDGESITLLQIESNGS